MTSRITCIVNDVALKNKGLQSEHGLSFWIETGSGTVLFDSGHTGRVLAHNMNVLGLDSRRVNAVVLSHAHSDHSGGLEWFLSKNSKVPLYAHADIFQERFSRKKGEYNSVGMILSREFVAAQAELHLSVQAEEVLPGLWTTGEIRERKEMEGRSAHHNIKVANDYLPDPYKDDMSLVIEGSRGLALICGCCHAGLLNTLQQVRREFEKPLLAVIGGTHLLPFDGPALRQVIMVLKEQFPRMVYYLNHCTGEHAIGELKAVFGERVAACPAGQIMDLDFLYQ